MNNSINYSSFISIPISINNDTELNEPSLTLDIASAEDPKPGFEQLQASIKNHDVEQWHGE